MKNWHIGSILAVALGVTSGQAHAYAELTGAAGVAACQVDAHCWTSLWGTMYNVCADYKMLVVPLPNHPNSSPPGPPPSVPWNAKFYASSGSFCSLAIVPDDGALTAATSTCGFSIPANGSAGAVTSAWGFSSGPMSPMYVSTFATPFTAAYAMCWIPGNGWVDTVTWW